MKRTIITTGIIVVITLIALIVFNKLTSKTDTSGIFTGVNKGNFEITVSATGELIAEKSIDIMGPEFFGGRDVRSADIKITDLVPEGTEVKAGDYVASLDRTELENILKDTRERLTSLVANLEMMLLDTAITMNNIRDQISNQRHTVDEAAITLRNSKYEPPTTIRQAEISLDQAQRVLDQLNRSYKLKDAQTRVNVRNLRWYISRYERRIRDYEDVLAGFVITAPSPGMIIYKRTRRGTKRKVGSMINPMDRVVATLPDLISMISKIFVSEVEVTKVQTGQPVIITIDAFPSKNYSGTVTSKANIGEKLPNTDTKVFEVLVRIDGTDMNLRPSMTTNNKILIKKFEDVIFIPIECVHTGSDSIQFVYTKSGYKNAVVLGESNEKDVIIKKGLEPGTMLYMTVPEQPEKFRFQDEQK
ncbi:MAG: HlyD family secretion protein [Bacteroidales bacterium]|jgi:multidrug efflux pump subunit AcrA (membrane-fusion protein)|nr:HlyD family secretion protein [Bacteroidales bacterium]